MLHHAADHLLLVVFGRHGNDRGFETSELLIIAADRYIVTIQERAIAEVATVQAEWQTQSPRRQFVRVGTLIYAILEALIDSYYPILDDIADDIENLDEAI